MRNFKKVISIVTLLIMLVSVFAGCAGKTPSSDEDSKTPESGTTAPEGSEKAAEDDGKFNTELSFVGVNNVISDNILENIDELEEKFGITLNFQQFSNEQASNKLAVSFAAGGGDVDAFMLRPLNETKLFIQNGWLACLDDYIEAQPEVAAVDDFFESSLGVCVDDSGSVHALPIMVEGAVVYYNKKIFEDKGIDKVPTTMDEMMEVAKKCHDPENDICGFACRGKGGDAVTMFSPFLRAFGGDFFDEEGNAAINTPEALAAFEFYGDILRNYGPQGVLNMGWTETMAVFTQGKAAMRLDADTNIPNVLDPDTSLVPAEDVGYFMVPVGPNGDSGTFKVTPWALGVSYGSKQKDAAWAFISWAAGKEMDLKCQYAGGSSARKSTWEVPDANTWPQELIDVANESAKTAHPTDRPYMINVGEARTVIGEVIVAAINGEDYKAAADKANADLQELIDSEK